MATLDIVRPNGKRRLFAFGLTHEQKKRVLALPGASEQVSKVSLLGAASFPLEPMRVEEIRAIVGNPEFAMSSEAALWYGNRRRQAERSLLVKNGGYNNIQPDAAWFAKLYPYQQVATVWLRFMRRAILGDEMGLGKTLEALTAADGCAKILVVTVNLAKRSVWQRHVDAYMQNTACWICEGNQFARRETLAEFKAWDKGVVVVNHEMLQSRYRQAYRILFETHWDLIILDEAHKFQDPQSSQSKGAALLQSEQLYLLTGTPVWNRPESIFGLLKLLDPERWSSFWTFVEEYCEVARSRFGLQIVGVKPWMQEKLQTLLAPYILRRVKTEVLPDLPVKRVQTISYQLTPPQLRAYRELKRKFRLIDGAGSVVKYEPSVSKTFADLRRLVNAPSLLHLQMEGAKTLVLDELLDEALSEGHKVVLFTWHHDYTDYLDAHLALQLIEHRTISGISGEIGKNEALADFRDMPEVKVLIASIGAAGTAVDGLQIADVAIFAEGSYVATQVAQAEDRLHRIGQQCDVMIYRLQALHTVEEAVWDTVEDTKAQAEEMLAFNAVLQRMMSETEEED